MADNMGPVPWSYAYMAIPENLTKKEYVRMAMLAKEAKRFKEMVKIMEKIVSGLTPADELTVDERKLLESAYRTAFFTLQTALLKIPQIEGELAGANERHLQVVKDYKSKIEAEISELCDGFLKLLKDNLEPAASKNESKVYYMSLRIDYNRLLAKFKSGDELEKVKKDALDAYNEAKEIAIANLEPEDPSRMILGLRISEFYFHVLHAKVDAFNLGWEALDLAKPHIDRLRGEARKEGLAIMKKMPKHLKHVLACMEDEELE